MTSRKILVLGSSHTRALEKALEEREPGGNGNQFEIHWVKGEKKPHLTRILGDLEPADAIEKTRQLEPDDVTVLATLGTGHNVFGLLRHAEPFHHHQSEGIPSGSQLVPENALLEFFVSFLKKNRVLKPFKEMNRSRVVQLATPPPKSDNQFIESVLTKYRDQEVVATGLNPASLRRAMWELEMRALRTVAAEEGIDFLPPPSESIDVDGCLKREYYAGDATHANTAYGSLVLDQLDRYANGGNRE